MIPVIKVKLIPVCICLHLSIFIPTNSPSVAATNHSSSPFPTTMASLLRSPQPMHYPPSHSHSFQFPPSRTPASFYPTRTPPPPQSHSPLANNQLAGLHASSMYGGNTLGPAIGPAEESKIYALVVDLMDPGTRESALLELSKKREQYDELALVLWHSFGRPVCSLPRKGLTAG